MGYPRQGIPLAHAPAILPALYSALGSAARPSRLAQHQAATDTQSVPKALQRLQTLVRRLQDPETRTSPGWIAERDQQIADRQREIAALQNEIVVTKTFVPADSHALLRKELSASRLS